MNLPMADIVTATGQQQFSAGQLEAWVCRGLMMFWRQALPVDQGVYQLLERRICELSGSELASEWQTDWPWLDAMADHERDNTASSLPLLSLAKDYQLDASHVYVLVLTGLLESSHLINLVLSELQAPDRAPRLSVHLACSLAKSLFPDSAGPDPLALAAHPLVANQVLRLEGDVPLPLQRLSINPWLWSLLVSGRNYWPGLRFSAGSSAIKGALPASLTNELTLIAPLLASGEDGTRALVLRGNPHTGRGRCADYLAHLLNRIPVDVPLDLWSQQPVLWCAARYGNWLPVLRLQNTPSQPFHLERAGIPLVIIAPEMLPVPEGNLIDVLVDTPDTNDRIQLWQAEGISEALSEQLACIARLSASAIHRVASQAKQLAQRLGVPLELVHIREARARLGVDKLRLLAQPVLRQVDDTALVVPSPVRDGLQLVLSRARQRESLWQGLGSTLSVTPNPGVRALFVGESGTGKTLAASYIATGLAAPLYRVDLSAVMNKYIGESEKNLAQLLDYAAATDVVLLFDEADALFGSRSDGQETGERFANMLTNFLLTRIESHPGVVILTTNSRERIDTAFTRRLDVIVEFPLPDFEERLHLWRSHLGERGPGDEVYRNLASYCDLAGGQVRNVVLTAASFAGGELIGCEHLLEGLRAEYRKQGRDMPRKLEGLVAN
ncbi:ATP-binding protein [Cellvibrio japonicus]|uniref:Putative AAA family ATPase n=1 Tax=Cellvibrio japonicus (strain Ueda107) TaxID=498211 RepID=B3PD80_CELJU|nr:ATP-binding protein [Cellvibrio japonicus]ACE86306.1 putative AAA family ATPase [Cellvibrio japonicus Ueda107]QEI13343.1 ATP-binding protein [Cellvibrio japonicus]QEI16917.1 ATP-binding protein [Cellvibrio japonicus]QEI20495.1 ATP-binding protein [Cellvibrio japonicus]